MPESEHPDYPSAPCGQEYRPSERVCLRVWRTMRWWLGGLGTLEIFTGILALSTVVQVMAFIESERAFISVDTKDVRGGKIVVNVPVIINLYTRNTGRSTGFVTDFNMTWTVARTLPSDPHYVFGGIKAITGPIISGASYPGRLNVNYGTDPLRFSQNDLMMLESGEVHFYVFGYIQYRDDFTIFKDTKVGYCGVYEPTDAIFTDCGESTYAYKR